MDNSKVIRVARVIGAAQADLYKAWTDPATKAAWWGKTARADLISCEMDARVGGRFRYEMRMPKSETAVVATGEHIEVSPPHRMIFTWTTDQEGGGGDVGATNVTLEFVDLKDGTTRGVVTHEGVSNPSVAAAYRANWANLLQDLAKHFASAR